MAEADDDFRLYELGKFGNDSEFLFNLNYI